MPYRELQVGFCTSNNNRMIPKKRKKNKKRKKRTKNAHTHPLFSSRLKILTAFGQGKTQGLVFVSSQYPYFGFSLRLYLQVKYIFHLC